jgi:uncharacterized repeat protein (TIGR01451 family)
MKLLLSALIFLKMSHLKKTPMKVFTLRSLKPLLLPAFAGMAIFLALLFSATTAKSQTLSVDSFAIYGSGCKDSSYWWMLTVNRPVSDPLVVTINFGDGIIDTFYRGPNDSMGGFFSGLHYYTIAGYYSIKIVAHTPTDSDSDIYINAVYHADSCGDITGRIYDDANSNCTYNSGETVYNGLYVALYTGGQLYRVTSTSGNGQYSFTVPAGPTYEVKIHGAQTSGYSTVCPSAQKYTVTTLPSNNNDFGVECMGGFDLTANLSGWGFRPGQQATAVLIPENKRCEAKSGTAKLILNSHLQYTSASPTPSSVNGNIITWNFSNLVSGGTNPTYTVYFMCDTTLNIGDTICLDFEIDPDTNDSVPGNNNGTGCFPVRNSYDPNMKLGAPYGEGVTGIIAPNTDITYTVYFQNTGTDVAFNISVIDSLDANIDFESFQYLGASHGQPKIIMLNPGVFKFRFDNIMLPDSNADEPGSHGFVQYKVKQKPNLANGTQIKNNSAGIYFDYNVPVITNNVLHTIDLSATVRPMPAGNNGKVYPNPVSSELFLALPVAGTYNLSVFSISGQEVMTGKGVVQDKEIISLDVANLKAGFYLLKVEQGGMFISHKFSKQ